MKKINYKINKFFKDNYINLCYSDLILYNKIFNFLLGSIQNDIKLGYNDLCFFYFLEEYSFLLDDYKKNHLERKI